MIPSSLRGWSMAAAVSMASALTMWTIAVVVSDLAREGSYPPWGLYFLWFLLLAVVWSGLSLLRCNCSPRLGPMIRRQRAGSALSERRGSRREGSGRGGDRLTQWSRDRRRAWLPIPT